MFFSYEFYESIIDFLDIPKGSIINNPNTLIGTNIQIKNQSISKDDLYDKKFKIYFTRKSLKHILEKDNVYYLLTILEKIINNPDYIYGSRSTDRYIYAKIINKENFRPYAVMLEFQNDWIIIVTIFQTDEKYLKNFKILWRTGAL